MTKLLEITITAALAICVVAAIMPTVQRAAAGYNAAASALR